MSPNRRVPGWVTGVGGDGAVPGLAAERTGHGNEEHVNVEVDSDALMSTPQAGSSSNPLFGTADFSRPVTRSARKGYFDSILVGSPSTQTQAQNRLLLATAGNSGPSIATSHLEEARDIDYGPEGRGGHELERAATGYQDASTEPQNAESQKSHPRVGGLRVHRRSDRIRAKAEAAREPSPSTILSAASCTNNNRVQRRRKKPTKTISLAKPVRRSARLAKPLDVFHKYPELPPELKLMVWEAAIEPRLTYICNRLSVLGHAQNFGIQNKLPSWFMACALSLKVAKKQYHDLFGQYSPSVPTSLSSLPSQAVNPSVDIVVFEPCHNGCRAFFCAQQYRPEDRALVQNLAVQIDSPHLLPTSEPGWVTISRSWPNVETLFMMKPAIRGLDQSDKAMIRIKEGDHELALRKLFEAWKKGPGQDHKLTALEFVRVVEQESRNKAAKDRYQSVEDRKTGLVEDIILG